MKVHVGQRFWITLTTLIFIFAVFVIGRNLVNVIKISHRISLLEDEREVYLQRIAEDSALYEQLPVRRVSRKVCPRTLPHAAA